MEAVRIERHSGSEPRASRRPSTIRSVPGSDDYFDEQVAATYDDDGPMFNPAVVTGTVDFLAKLAGGGRALELGIGNWPNRSSAR